MIEQALTFIQPYALLIKLVLVAAVLGAAFYGGYDYHRKVVAEDQLELERDFSRALAEKQLKIRGLQIELNNSAMDLEIKLDGVRTDVRHTQTVIQQEIEKPVYSQCVVPESGWVLIEEHARRLAERRAAGGDSR